MSVDLATLALKVEALEVDAASRKLDNLTAAGGRTEKAAGGMSTAFRALGAALATVQLTNMIKESALMAARYETMGAAMVTVGNNAGYTGSQMAEYEKRLRSTGIAMIESRETLTKMAASHIDLAKATDLARIAQDAAVIGNINSSEAFDRMINGIRSGEVEVLRGIGLNVNFEQSYAKLADQLGKNAKDLSETEKGQARVNSVLAAGTGIAGTYEAAMGTAGKMLNSMQRYADDLKVSLGAAFGPAVTLLVDQMTGALKDANAEVRDGQSTIDAWGIKFRSAIISIEAELIRLSMLIDKVGGTMTAVLTGAGELIDVASNIKGAVSDMYSGVDSGWAESELTKLGKQWNKVYEDRYKAGDKALQDLADLELKLTNEVKGGTSAQEEARIKAGLAARAQQELDDKKSAASKEAEASAKKARSAAEAAAKASAQEYQSILDSLEPVRVEQEEYNKALAVLNKLDPTHETERYKAALEELNKTTKEGQELENHRAEIMGDLDDYERQVAQARMTDAERQIDDINRQTDALIKYGYELAKLDPKYQALADEGAAAFGEKARKDIEAITDDANQMGKMFDDVAKSIQGAFSDMFLDMMNDTDNTLDSIGDMFKKLLAQMATMAIAQPIIVPIVFSIGSAMGVSNASIAKSLGMDVSGLSGIGGLGSMFSSGSLQSMGVSALSGIGSGLQYLGLNGLGNSFMSGGEWLNGLSGVLGDSLTAGVGSLLMSALTGNLNTSSLFQAGGAAIGSIFGPIGSVAGGLIGSLVGGLFGDDNNEFGFDPKYSYGGNWNATTGQLDSTYEKPTTSHWSGAIFTAYGEQVVAVQEAFNEQVAALSKALPEEAADLMYQSLAAVDYKELLAASSAGKWDTDYAEDAIEQVVTRYSEAMLKQLGLAVGAGVTGYLDSNGAAGLVGSDKVWGLLTTEVQENIETAFRSAGDAISAGDYEKGLTAITDVQTAIAAIESAMAPISEIIDTAGLSDYELSLRSINQQFDQYSDALKAAGVDMDKYTDLETARGIKLAEAQKAEDARLAAMAEQRKRLEIKIMEASGDSAGALSATRAIELAAMDESLRPLQQRIYSLQDEATATAAANEAAKKLINESITGLQAKIDDMITRYGDLTAAMAELDPVAATLVDSWRANKTELENLISGLASAMGELPEQTALERLQSTLSALASATNGIANLNDQIFALQTGTASSAAIELLKAREQELFDSMATSLDPGSVASELASVITKRITMQASLEEDAVNARYKAEYEAANTVAELEKQLRTDQISALQEQISAAKTLVDVVSSMPQFLAELRYSDLSSLNPGDQLATAKGSFESIMASAMSGDAEAMQQLQSVGSSYLKEAQGYYGGATSQYAAVFADVTNALEQFGAQPVTDIDLLQSQVEYLQGIETATNTLNSTTIDTTDQQIDALIDVRDALTKREEQLSAQKEEDRKAVQAQIDQLNAVVTGQEAQIRQQAAMHAELMAQLAQANASLEALENTASLEAAAPA